MRCEQNVQTEFCLSAAHKATRLVKANRQSAATRRAVGDSISRHAAGGGAVAG